MSYEDWRNELSQREKSDSGDSPVSQPACSPGKRTLTLGLPPRSAHVLASAQTPPVQQKVVSAAAVQGEELADRSSQWMDAAVRPDLHDVPVQFKGDPVGPGYYAAGQTTREIGFALRHPLIAIAIGSVSPGSLNISTNAARFSTNDLGLEETDSHEGSEVNAFRHTLWQAEITEDYGEQIAHEVGNAHEANPFAISGANRNTTNFSSESEADQSADLRNNEIGRSIGTTDNPVAMNELALQVLDYFHAHGLWVAEEQPDGTWSVVQRRISDERYTEAHRRLLELNEYGYAPDQWNERQQAEEARQRELMERLGRKGCCFVGATPVATAHGLQRIDRIDRGDLVLAQLPHGKVAVCEVEEVQVHRGEFSLLAIDLESEQILVTTRHRFGMSNGGWLSSENIAAGTRLRGASQEQVVKATTQPSPWSGTVYNLKVRGGSYFVGNDKVLVRDC